MALPSTGSISMSQVNTELKKSATATISLNDSAVRKLAGKTSGTISMNDLRGKKASETVTNYQIYNNSWSGSKYRDNTGNFTVNFPHKIISGTLIVTSSWSFFSGYDYRKSIGNIKILDQTIQEQTKNISIADIMSVTGQYYTGWSNKSLGHGDFQYGKGTVTVDIKFTGEWEA